jgi:uncharacterized Fe-S radical SAM superfamily protein PflX
MASKYQGKKQGKGKSKSAPVVVRDERAPAFLYTSECCGELAKKDACVIDRGVKFEDRKAALGHWRCSACRRACKVIRKLNKEGIIPFRPKAAALSAVTLLAIAEALVPGSVDRVFASIGA